MNKPITMAIKEAKQNLIRVCNESGLSPVILDLILQGLYSEIHTLAEKQTEADEIAYIQSLSSNNGLSSREIANLALQNDDVSHDSDNIDE